MSLFRRPTSPLSSHPTSTIQHRSPSPGTKAAEAAVAALAAKHKAEEAARERAEAAKHPNSSKPAIGHREEAEEEERVHRNVSFFGGYDVWCG